MLIENYLLNYLFKISEMISRAIIYIPLQHLNNTKIEQNTVGMENKNSYNITKMRNS